MHRFSVALAALIALAAVTEPVEADTEIVGTGSAFAAPVYVRWADDAKAAIGIRVNYQATGSGVGQKQVTIGTVDFGASDVPMDPAKLAAADIMQFPTVVGGLDLFVNLPGIGPDTLRLSGPVLADIYLGGISRWNDRRIADLNPTLSLHRICREFICDAQPPCLRPAPEQGRPLRCA